MNFEPERSGEDRRKIPQVCLLHREEMDQLQRDLTTSAIASGKTSGRFTAMLWFLGVIGTILVVGVATLLAKTSDIQTLLSKNDVILMQHTERLESLRKEVDEIKTRNRYIDQQSMPKPNNNDK
jgi:hypothetical protein